MALFGDSITTDHISPAGSIKDSLAGRPVPDRHTACSKADFNSYGSRRGNHEVMMRGTFANVRIKNLMIPPGADGSREEGGVTLYQPGGEKLSDLRRGDEVHGRRHADRHLRRRGVRHRLQPRLGRQGHAAAGHQGRGGEAASSASTAATWSAWACCRCSSRAATSWQSLGLKGDEVDRRRAGRARSKPQSDATLVITGSRWHTQREVTVTLRIDTPIEVDYYQHGGILPFVLRQLLAA